MTTRGLLAFSSMLASVACSPSPAPREAPRAAPAPSPEAARAAAKAILDAQYGALGRGDVDAFAARLAPDAFVFGDRADDAFASKAALVSAFKAAFEKPGVSYAVHARGARVGVSRDGRAAWLNDEYEISEPGHTVAFRVTEILGERGGAWWVLAGHFSRGLPRMKAFALADEGRLPALADTGSGGGAGTDALVATFDEAVADVPHFLAAFSTDPAAFMFGGDPKEAWDAMTIRSMRLRSGAMANAMGDAGPRFARKGGARAGLAPGGHLGWVAANLDFTVTVPAANHATHLPFRALVVFAREGGEPWSIVTAHYSEGQ